MSSANSSRLVNSTVITPAFCFGIISWWICSFDFIIIKYIKQALFILHSWAVKIKEFSQKLQIWRKINSGLIIKVQKEIVEEKNEIIVQLEEDLEIEREEAAKALEKAKEWRERQLKELTTQKDQRIKELEQQLESLKLKLEEKIEIPSK